MKRNNHPYAEITSFEDFDREQERLMMKQQLIEARLSNSISKLGAIFSITNVVFSLAKEFIYPKISKYLASFISKLQN